MNTEIIITIKNGVLEAPLEVLKEMKKQGHLLEREGVLFINFPLKALKKSISNNQSDDAFKVFVDEWMNLFPTQLIPTGSSEFASYRVSGNRPKVVKELRKFMRTNPEITTDEILQSTAIYLHRQSLKNYHYTQKNFRFVKELLVSFVETLRTDVNARNEANVFLNQKSPDNFSWATVAQ